MSASYLFVSAGRWCRASGALPIFADSLRDSHPYARADLPGLRCSRPMDDAGLSSDFPAGTIPWPSMLVAGMDFSGRIVTPALPSTLWHGIQAALGRRLSGRPTSNGCAGDGLLSMRSYEAGIR